MKKTILNLLISVMLVTLLSSCQQSSGVVTDEFDNSKPTIYVSVFPMYDFAKKIVNDKFNVVQLVPEGQEPHAWEMTPKDMTAIEGASLFIYSGAGLEGWIDTLISAVTNKDIVFVDASNGVELITGHNDESHDPHVWLNPKYAKIQLKNIADAVSQVDPDNGSFYQKNYDSVALQMDTLDRSFSQAVQGFTNKTLVVPHEAYGYLCEEYGLTQMAVSPSLEGAEPSAQRLKEIIDYVNNNNIRTIFYDVNQSPELINKIYDETEVALGILNAFEVKVLELDYFDVMEQNLLVLKDAFENND